jgi:DNA polymerase III delta subunit
VNFQFADELENIDLAINLALEKLDVGYVGGELIEHRINEIHSPSQTSDQA